MRKIFVLAGIVLFFSFIAMCWLFFGNFFDFAKNLGEESEKIEVSEKSRFIGTWETTYIEGDERFIGDSGIYKFKTDGTGEVGGLDCIWNLSKVKLVITYNEGYSILSYNYTFSKDDSILTLNNDIGSLIFNKIVT